MSFESKLAMPLRTASSIASPEGKKDNDAVVREDVPQASAMATPGIPGSTGPQQLQIEKIAFGIAFQA